MGQKFLFLAIICIGGISRLSSQNIDLLIKNGHVIDPKNSIDAVMDIAIDDGRIIQVGRNLNSQADKTIDATGLYVSPGFIDLHGHHFFGTEQGHDYSNSFNAVAPDPFTFRSGVTAVVDAGGSGWRNFQTFKAQTIDHSRTKVFALLNIVGNGMSGGPYEQNLSDMDAKLTSMIARRYPQYIVGIKLAHYSGNDWTPTERAAEAARLANIPLMVDFGGATPALSIETLFMDKLSPGDIFTHCYAQLATRVPIVKDGNLEPYIKRAQDRGIIFDVGHGGGSFRFSQAIPAIKQGLKPNTISTDLHIGSMNGGMKDMSNVMSKLLNIGLTLNEVIEASTWKPAQVISKEELGHLTVGAPADIAIFNVDSGNFGYVDTGGEKVTGDKKIVCELTLLDGDIVWDLNGLSATSYK